jgi:hypothetical protein
MSEQVVEGFLIFSIGINLWLITQRFTEMTIRWIVRRVVAYRIRHGKPVLNRVVYSAYLKDYLRDKVVQHMFDTGDGFDVLTAASIETFIMLDGERRNGTRFFYARPGDERARELEWRARKY